MATDTFGWDASHAPSFQPPRATNCALASPLLDDEPEPPEDPAEDFLSSLHAAARVVNATRMATALKMVLTFIVPLGGLRRTACRWTPKSYVDRPFQ